MKDRPGSSTPFLPEHLGVVVDHLQEGLQVLAPDWTYLYVNEAAALHGRMPREQLLGRRLVDLYPGMVGTPAFATLSQCMAERVPAELQNEFTYPDGSVGWFELRIRPVPEGIVVLSVDVTERRALAEKLEHSRAMEAVGRLAGGVAHDFNNILAAINGFGEVAMEAVGPRHEAYLDLVQIMEAVERAEALVSQLVALSARRSMQVDVVDVNEHLAHVLPMLRQLATPTVRVELVTGAVAGRVCMDRSALERVVVNLVVNARDAMPGGGVVRVETSGVEASATEPRDQVRITVSDQGEGMSPETLEHLFEPFFTTKALGRGTGLGLSTCQGLVRQAGGSIRVQSALGVGTTFDILLPRCDGEPTVPAISPAMRGSETVLVVEPDPARRDPMQHALRAAGYLVASARDGAEAFDRTQENGSRVDLLAVRPVLPDMSGRLLYQCLRHEYPDLRAVFLEPEEASFDPERLLRVVRSELDAR